MDEKNIQVVTNKGKMFDFHKIFAAIGLILVVAIIIVSGVWYFVEGRHTNTFSDDQDTVKVSTSSAKSASKSATQSATESANN